MSPVLRVVFGPCSGHGPVARWWHGDGRGPWGQPQWRPEGKGQLSKVWWITIQQSAFFFGISARGNLHLCVSLEQCIRMQISTCWMTHSVPWMLKWEGTYLKSESSYYYPPFHLEIQCKVHIKWIRFFIILITQIFISASKSLFSSGAFVDFWGRSLVSWWLINCSIWRLRIK